MELGRKIYRYIEDELIVGRIVKIVKEKYYIKLEGVNELEIHTLNSLRRAYEYLKPAGNILISKCVTPNNTVDVFVTLYKGTDLYRKEKPYAICRQNHIDVFDQMLMPDNPQYGLSISNKTVPADLPFDMLWLCNGVHKHDIVAVYLDDSLDDILSLFNNKDYDNVLCDLYNQAQQVGLKGFNKTLKDLLINNNFMHDFYELFDLVKADFELIIMDDDSLLPAQIDAFSKELNMPLYNTLVLKYSYDVTISDLKSILKIIDINNNLYLVGYSNSPDLYR